MYKILQGIFHLSVLMMFSCNTIPKNTEPKQCETNNTKNNIYKENYLKTSHTKLKSLHNSEHNNVISYGNVAGAKLKEYEVTRKYFPSMAQNFRQRYIIIHHTTLNNEKSIEVLTKRNVSVHYLINDIDDNEIYQLVDENKRAYHAGMSSWKHDNNLNDTSIGIEIVNMGITEKCYDDENITECEKIFHDYPDYQIEKTIALIKDLAERYDIPPTNILAHSDIAPTRKQDPGPKFPWKKLYDIHQLGMWYDEDCFNAFLKILSAEDFDNKKYSPDFIYEIQNKFRCFGYDIVPSSEWDKDTMKVIRAFQYHFYPKKGDGILDIETYAILLSLLKKYPNTYVKSNS